MKMECKLVLMLLSAALMLPAQGFAGDAGAAPKPVARKKVPYDPANCPVRGKFKTAATAEKRRQIVAEKTAKGDLQGEKVTYNPKAAKAHGKQK